MCFALPIVQYFHKNKVKISTDRAKLGSFYHPAPKIRNKNPDIHQVVINQSITCSE
jgi:hypothetical protein